MKINVTRRVGNTTLSFEVVGEKYRETLEKVTQLPIPPGTCRNCESSNVELHAYRTKENDYLYVKVRCLDCKATTQLHEGKDGKNFWWDKEWTIYNGGNSTAPVQAKGGEDAIPEEDPGDLDDLPF